MMFERFTDDARAVVVSSQGHARRLGHNYIGCEHLLLSLASLEGEVGEIVRGAGATPQAIDSAVGRMAGLGPQWFQGVDREALAAIGIDLDAVRETVEAEFGRPPASCRQRWWRRRRRTGDGAGHIPFTPRAKKCLELSLREAIGLRHQHIGPEHILLGLTRITDSMAAEILRALGVSADALRTETINRHRKAG